MYFNIKLQIRVKILHQQQHKLRNIIIENIYIIIVCDVYNHHNYIYFFASIAALFRII